MSRFCDPKLFLSLPQTLMKVTRTNQTMSRNRRPEMKIRLQKRVRRIKFISKWLKLIFIVIILAIDLTNDGEVMSEEALTKELKNFWAVPLNAL